MSETLSYDAPFIHQSGAIQWKAETVTIEFPLTMVCLLILICDYLSLMVLKAAEVATLVNIIMPRAVSGQQENGVVFTVSHRNWQLMSDVQQWEIFKTQHVHVLADDTSATRALTDWDEKEMTRFLFLDADRHVTGIPVS